MRASSDLEKLEYPRHLHKAGGAFLIVASADEASTAIADGWCVDANAVLGPAEDEPTPPKHGTHAEPAEAWDPPDPPKKGKK